MLRDLGWINAGGQTRDYIEQTRIVCVEALKHHPIDHPDRRAFDHEVTCSECGYTYHYDSGD